ncbi:MAG: hypothetical protein GX100_13100 [candidate division WS1 bacterium]|jgi:hypothetical protein|nr:hypothetical protein [candidate division WS1 bacterium]
MTPRERMQAVFRGEEPDVMVWFGDLSYWHFAHGRIGDLPAAWEGPIGRHQMHRDLGVGEYVPCSSAYDLREGDEVHCRREEKEGLFTTTWETPAGTLTARQQYSRVSFSYGYLEYPVKSAADLEIVRYIEERRVYLPIPERAGQVNRELGDFGVPVDALPATPLGTLLRDWTGITSLAFLVADEPEEIQKTVDCLAEAQNEPYRLVAESADHLCLVAENLSAETMGGYFDRYLKDYLTMRVAGLHAAGKQVFIHLDGTLRGVAEKVPATGIDCLDAVTPKPVGDVAMEHLRALIGEEILVIGGLPGAMFAPPFTAEDMRTHVLNIIRLHKDSGTFMFGVADQVPPNADLGIVRLVGDLVEEYARYN